VTLGDIANIVEIAGVAAVIAAIIFGWLQVRHYRNESRNAALMELARSFEDKDFTEAYLLVTALPREISLADLQQKGEACENAALRIGMKFETIGLMIYKGYIPIDALEDLVGEAAIALWEVLRVWIYEMREDRSHPTFMEWFQWLVDRLEERGRRKRPPAFEIYNDWVANR
jgi:hypothetical protein